MAHNTSREVGQAIGKPLEALSSAASAQAPSHAEINWVNFNYPIGLRLIHYSPDELPSTISGLVWCLNLSFQLTSVVCTVNFIDNLVLLIMGQGKFRWILQSAVHFVLLPMTALAVFYAGYRGIAEPDATLQFRFKVGQPVLAAVYFIFGLVPWGCMNGLAQFGGMDGSTVFWTVAILLESSLWLANGTLSASNAYRLANLDLYGPGMTAASTRF